MDFIERGNRKIWLKSSVIFLFLLVVCCKNKVQEQPTTVITQSESDTLKQGIFSEKKSKQIEVYHDDFVNIKSLSDEFVLHLKYATTDNFLKQAVYDCPECLLRKETAKALVAANESFKKLGYRIKIFDCYRPLSVQQKMWDILPGTHYVANPAKGSKHNRGAAVDITLVDSNGNELDMGTEFDYFGKEAHHNYANLLPEVLKNRNLLKSIMDQHNFRSIYSEWWHYEFRPERDSKVENFTWECP